MASKHPVSARLPRSRASRLVRQYRSVITASVEGLALLLRLPLLVHVILTVATNLAIGAFIGRHRRP